VLYVVALVAVACIAAGYFEHRDLRDRYQAHLDRKEAIEDAVRDCEDVQVAIESTDLRIGLLERDQVEREARLRDNENMAQEDETLFRIVVTPDDAPHADGDNATAP